MEYAEDYEVSPEGYALSDTPHVEIMFDALEHTAEIEGTESLTRINNLTQAQHYAVAVLDAAGIKYGMRAGNEEGVFSAIGNGFAAVWDYIKKTFKAIWDFFFNRDGAKEADEAKETVDEANKDLKAAEAGTQSDEDAAKQATKMAAATEGKVSEDLKAAKTPAEKKKAIKAALAAMAKMNKGAQAKLANTIKAAINAKAALAKAMTGEDPKVGGAAAKLADKNHPAMQLLLDMGNDLAKFSLKDAAFLKQLQGVPQITTPAAAIAFGEAAKKNIDDLKGLVKTFDGNKGKIQTIITQTEAKMKKAKDAGDKKELTAEIGALRTLMVSATRVSKLISANFTRVSAAHKDLTAVFGM